MPLPTPLATLPSMLALAVSALWMTTLPPARAATPPALDGTAWDVTGYHNGRQAVTSPVRGPAPTLEFLADDRLGGSAGCNRFTGRWTQTGRKLEIPQPAATRRQCAEPAGVMEQETAFLAALASATALRIDGDRLELRTADDRLAIRATRRPAATAPPAPAPLAAPATGTTQTFAADLTYLADAAVVVVCRGARRYPVAMEADWLAMERAYVATAKPPGSPLHVTFEGRIVERPKMDGAGTESTMLVQRFIHAWPGETCERAMADANFANTYWKIVRLDATDVVALPGRREPQLLIGSPARDGLQGDYSATVGCNTFRGRYRDSGQALQFTAGATTRMACPPPLDALERQLGELLARTARRQVTANTLELFDAAGGTLGLLQAVHF
jgi:heat shock protein HslJ